jgi:alkaline phosphatase D
LQGATDDTSTQIAILVPKSLNFKYSLIEKGSNHVTTPTSQKRKQRSTSIWGLDHIRFESLKPATQYQLRIEDFFGSILDQRSLRTLPTGLTSVKIALASCMSDAPIFERIKIWETLANQNPDMIFFLGDNVYAAVNEMADPETLWDRYVQTRLSLEVFKKESLIPIFATWDDHDFGQNDGNKNYPYVNEAQQVFRDFFPQEAINDVIDKGPGVSQAVNLLNHRFIFLDDRSFRDDPHGESMWGLEQELWLQNQMETANTPLWIINGSQIFGKYGPSESLESDYPNHFQRFTTLLSTLNKPIMFISGDIHASEIMQIPKSLLGFDSLELTSSSMHSAHSPIGQLKDNPRRINGFDGDSFLLVNLTQSSMITSQTIIKIQGFSKEQTPLFEIQRDTY